jgi:hypothetical protein
MQYDPDIARIIKKLGGVPNATPKPKLPKKTKIKLTAIALHLLQRKDLEMQAAMEPAKSIAKTDCSDHKFPPTYIGHLWETAGERRFEDFQRSYNGVQRKLETGNLTHDLTTLIRTRG